MKSGTIDAAEFSGVAAKSGSIAIGKLADMILLDANPLADVRNTRRIDAVFFNGQLFNRDELDLLLEFAEQRAASIHSNLHLLWAALNSPLMRVQIAD